MPIKNLEFTMDIKSNVPRKHWHEYALTTAAHILVRLTKEGKSHEEIAREDFNNNLELVTVWIDYMAAINWIYDSNNGSNNNKWIATDNGIKWVEKISTIHQMKYSDMLN